MMYSFGKACFIFTILALCCFGKIASAQTYNVIDLGTLGGSFSMATAINSEGEVVGGALTADGTEHAFLWHNGVMSDLGLAPGFTSSLAWDINDSGQIVGEVFVNNTSKFHAFYYSNGVLQDIGAMGAPTNFPTQSVAQSINNAGEVVGNSTTPTDSNAHAIQWDPVHGFTDLSKTIGAEGTGESINNAGLVVGNFGDAAAIYNGGTPQILLSDLSTAYDVNNLGVLVGSTDTTIFNGFPSSTINYGHAFLYQNGQLSNLGTLPGFGGSAATAINDSGIAVGNVFNMDTSANITAQHAVLDSGSGFVDLNTLISANSGWTLNYARDINDVGQIVGLGTLNGQQHAYLLTPTAVPEPDNIALILGIGVAGIACWRRRCIRV